MGNKFFLLSFLLFSGLAASAQSGTVRGRLADAQDRTPLGGATVTLRMAEDTTKTFSTVSRPSGFFMIQQLQAGRYKLAVSSVGYELLERELSIQPGKTVALDSLILSKSAELLDAVTVQAEAIPVRQKEDTLEYSAAAFKVNPDANADDVVRKMPGITIENGVVKAGGEDVRRVTVDGRDFFGEDAMAALRNLPAEVVDKIQVFDRMSDQARFTGFDDGNTTRAINIVTKAGMRNGQFGRIYAGYGTDERYSGGGNVSLFHENRRISIVGLTNNINQQNFSSEDLLGVTSSSGGGRGGFRGRGPGGYSGGGRTGGGDFRGSWGGGSSNFLIGQQGGITKTNAIGINYSDLWGKKTEVTASYFFNNNENTSNERVSREFFTAGDSSQRYDENSLSTSTNNNHRFNMRLEHRFDSANSLLITPSVSWQGNNSFNGLTGVNSIKDNQVTSRTQTGNTRNSSGYNIGNNLLYRHAFPKRGRSLSIGLNTSLNARDGDTYQDAINRYYEAGEQTDSLLQHSAQQSEGYRISANIAYTEPLSRRSQLQVEYNPSWSRTDADQQTFRYDEDLRDYTRLDSSLSNVYDNLYATQRGGISFRTGDRDNSFSIGLSYQEARLTGEQKFPFATSVSREFSNLLPNLMWRQKISQRSSLRLYYRTETNEPSISQLQEVINISNPLFLRTGNPDLQQELSHRVIGRYTFTNPSRGQSFLANIYYARTGNYIANATYIAQADSALSPTVTLYRGSQLTKPVNLEGYWSLRSFFTFGMPLRFIKSTVNLNLGYNFSHTPGQVNRIENLSKSENLSAGVVVSSNVSEFVDFSLSYNANFNQVRNSIQPSLNNRYFNQSARIQFNLLSKTGWFIQNDLSQQSYSGLTDGFNQSFWLWNLAVGKKFLKDQKGDLRLSVFDLLKQNQSISRTATETYIEDLQTQVLQQYFMLTFSYRLRNFGGRR